MDVLAGVPAQLVTGGGAAGLVALAVWLVLSGRLIPRSTHDSIVAGKDEHIRYLEATVAVEVERGRVRDGQVTELLEHSRTAAAVLRVLQAPHSREAA